MLSVTAEAEPIKTLVGLGRPIEDEPSLGFFDESLPDSGVRELEEPDDDGFSDNEADTRVEVLPPDLDGPDGFDAPDGPASEDWVDAPESSPPPQQSDLAGFGEWEPLPANWEDADEEATRPQLFLPDHPSEPPPGLPGMRLADSDAAAAQPFSAAASLGDPAFTAESFERVELNGDAAEGRASHSPPPPSSAFEPSGETDRPGQGLNPRLSGMLAGAGMGAATAIALVALFAWRSSEPEVTAVPAAPALPLRDLAPNEAVPTGSATLAEASGEERTELLGAEGSTANASLADGGIPASLGVAAPAPSERGTLRNQGAPVTALPVKLEEEAVVSGAQGMLRVSSLPPAHVVLDGRPLGMTPKLLPVSAGEHTVLFVHPELGRKTLRVSVGHQAKAEAFAEF